MQAIAPDTTESLDVYSPRETRSKLGNVSEATIWRMRQRGEFPEPIKISPGRVGYRRADIEQFVKSGWKPRKERA